MAQHGYKIRGIAPPDLASYPTSVRVLYWGWVVEFGLRRKDKELSQGLDKDGDPLRPIKQATREHRRSAMTPSGRGDPSAPPLEPGWQKSRTRSLLAGRALSSHAEFYWRYDAFTGDTWAVILGYQAQQGRDVFGLSPEGVGWVEVQARKRWEAWKAGQYRLPAKATQAAPGPIRAVGRTDERFLVRGANAGAVGPNAGYMTVKEWQAHFRETARASLPGRTARPASRSPVVGPDYNRLLGHVWTPKPSNPVVARTIVALPPQPKPAETKPIAAMPIGRFAQLVLAAARSVPETARRGGKVWIVDAYEAFVRLNPGFSLEEFKRRLLEANRQRLVTLARSDLPAALGPAERAKEAASEINAGIATFHWIRA